MRPTPPKVPRPSRAPIATSPGLGDNPDADALARFRAAHPITPVIEPDSDPASVVVTFLFDDADADEVLLFVNRLTDETHLEDSLMRRIAGTATWTLSYRVSRGWRASYAMLVRPRGEPAPWLADGDQVAIRAALDQGHRDPTNPHTCRNRAGVTQSVAQVDGAPPQPWLLRRDDVPRGTVHVEQAPEGRRVWTYSPAGVDDVDLPAVVVLDGEVWTSSQDLPTTLDNLVADGEIPPVRAFMLDSGGRHERWRTMGAGGDVAGYVTDALLPWIRTVKRSGLRPDDVVLAGQSLGGLTALRIGLTRPDLVGGVVAQSASLWQDDLADEVAAAAASSYELRVYLEVGLQEWVLLEPNRRLAARLGHAGVAVREVEYDGGHDYACWRGGIADGLRALLGPQVEGGSSPASATTRS